MGTENIFFFYSKAEFCLYYLDYASHMHVSDNLIDLTIDKDWSGWVIHLEAKND